jgi:hypothetical protein
MTWIDFVWSGLSSAAGLTVLVGVLVYLSRTWLEARLKESIKAEFDRAHESFKKSLEWEDRRRQQAAEVAELFSMWLRPNYDQSQDVNIQIYELQRKYWQLALWLDAPVFNAVNEAINTGGIPQETYKKALILVRKRMLEADDDPITWGQLRHFDPVPR